jgi:hypothetical protein
MQGGMTVHHTKIAFPSSRKRPDGGGGESYSTEARTQRGKNRVRQDKPAESQG